MYLCGLLLCWLVFFSVFGCAGSGPSQSSSGSQFSNSPSNQPGFLTTDREILANLKQNLKLEPRDMGGGGRCLFHSLREQISQDELHAISNDWDAALKNDVNGYAGLNENQKADLLRRIAIVEERDFLETKNNKDKKFDQLRGEDQAWALEMAKDWYEELNSRDQARTWYQNNSITAAGREIMWQYVIAHRNNYWAKTSCDTNWAGSAEAIVFARKLSRPLEMYGLDKASSDQGAQVNADGVVLPYVKYDLGFTKKPLLIWQVGGGGHYQMLIQK